MAPQRQGPFLSRVRSGKTFQDLVLPSLRETYIGGILQRALIVLTPIRHFSYMWTFLEKANLRFLDLTEWI